MALYAFQQGQPDPPRRLESGGYDELIQDLTISPDGRYVVFASDRPGPRPGKPAPARAATPKGAAQAELRKAP
jgi:hypothetical protein